MDERRPWLILGAGAVVAAAIVGGALVVSGRGDPASAVSAPESRTLPDGSLATAAQDAYLDAVEPHLTAEKAADILSVLSSGESVCTVWRHPSDPGTQAQSAQALADSSGYNQTEATVITRAAAEHLCPGK